MIGSFWHGHQWLMDPTKINHQKYRLDLDLDHRSFIPNKTVSYKYMKKRFSIFEIIKLVFCHSEYAKAYSGLSVVHKFAATPTVKHRQYSGVR